MSRPNVYVKYEENTPYFAYGGGGQWGLSTDERWSGKVQTWPAFAANPERLLGSMTFAFNGIAVAFVGNTPPIQSSQTVTVSIDGGEPYNTSYSDPLPQSYRQWYQSPTLPDGEHTISLDNIDLTGVDYALVTAGESTPLQEGYSTVVDDDDTNHFMFAGRWLTDPSPFLGPIDGLPFRNATHRTSTVGDQMYFRFAGTSVSLYGIFNWAIDGRMSANYTIDSASSTGFTYTSSPLSDKAGLGQQPNFLLFQIDGLNAGEHTLVMTVTDIVNQTLVVDYATYRPSFSSISNMPALGEFVYPDPTPMATSSPENTGPPDGDSSRGVPVGIIAGGVVGGLALIITGLIAWWLIRRRGLSGERGSTESGYPPAPTPFITTSIVAESAPTFGSVVKAHDAFPSQPLAGSSQLGRDRAQSQSTLNASTLNTSTLSSTLVGTASSSQPSGSHPATTLRASRPRTLAQRQAQLRREMRELEARVQRLDQDMEGSTRTRRNPTSSRNREAEVLELRRQLEELRRENAMLTAPPAYEDQGAVAEAAGPSGSGNTGHSSSNSHPADPVRAPPHPGQRIS